MDKVAFWDKTWSRKYERYNRHHQIIYDSMIKYLKGKVVDLGCGPCVMYENKTVDLTGVDWSEEALLQAKLHYPTGTYVKADATKTGLPSGQFDTVIAMGLLDYFDDWTPVINEMRRLVKKDGNILATLLNGFWGHQWTEEVVNKKTNVLEFKHITSNWYLIRCVP